MPDGSAAATPPPSSLCCRREPLAHRRDRRLVRNDDLEAVETARALRWRRHADTGPRVEPDVVVVAAGRGEHGPGIAADRDVEPDAVDPERGRASEIGDLEVHMAEHGPVRHRRRLAVGARLGEQSFEVEGKRRHRDLLALSRPFRAGSVAIQLDPVALGVREVERLADEVVGGAAEMPARVEDAPERMGQVDAVRDEQRQVEETGRPPGSDGRIGRVEELDDRAAPSSEHGDPVVRRQGA